MSRRLVALYRSQTYSPLQHARNDVAILDQTAGHFERQGWQVRRLGEDGVVAGALPASDLYLNMCQGAPASEALVPLEATGVPIFNRPASVLACHRHRLMPRLEACGLPVPRTLVVPASEEPETARGALDRLRGHPLWVKRGDVHAVRPEDVVAVRREELHATLAGFAARGIRRVAVQEHVPGPVIKFYALADGSLFHCYVEGTGAPPPRGQVDLESLRRVAFAAAACVGLQVFGGDAAVPDPAQPVLIDLNDWPSFAPVRARAAEAIARFIRAALERGVAA